MSARYTFDGFGINDAQDPYCARIATFTKHGLACVPSAQDLTDRLNAPASDSESVKLAAEYWAKSVNLSADNHALREALHGMIAIWEGPRDRAAVRFADAIVKARKLLELQP